MADNLLSASRLKKIGRQKTLTDYCDFIDSQIVIRHGVWGISDSDPHTVLSPHLPSPASGRYAGLRTFPGLRALPGTNYTVMVKAVNARGETKFVSVNANAGGTAE